VTTLARAPRITARSSGGANPGALAGYAEAGVVGLIQGVSARFPISSLGHHVLIPAPAGGCWAQNLNVATSESPVADVHRRADIHDLPAGPELAARW
jgi:hypothetical protein